jgi:N-acetylglutamate synthase-like GNAT family acetyltransferase
MVLKLTNIALGLRPIQDEDLMVLNEIYSSTREEELKQLPTWSEEQKKGFLAQQFMAQHTYYQKNYVGAAFYLIQKNKENIGRLYIHENFQENNIRIIDIALLPKWQHQGIGKGILEDILSKATEIDKPVSIHVESFNPAMKLYKKLGFQKISETNGVYHLMEWRAE